MPVLVNYERPIFWKPVNANGAAASIHGDINGKSIIINLYWAGMMLATRPEGSNMQVLRREAQGFLEKYLPKPDDESVQHFELVDGDFYRIVDPKWTPGY